MPNGCVMIPRCAGSSAARRLRAVRLHQARWAASRRSGLRQIPTCPRLTDLSGQWIDLVHNRRPPRGIVLDMDSSVSPTHGEQEMSVWNGHYQCTCYHPLFVFNQFGDLERCALRPGNVHSADGWEVCSSPSWTDTRVKSHASISGRCRIRDAGGLRVPGGRADQICDPSSRQPGPAEQDRLSAQASGRDRPTKSGDTTPTSPTRQEAGASHAE